MTEVEHREGQAPMVDPDESPFKTPPIEGMPYEQGSEEDRAIRRVIEENDLDREGESRSGEAAVGSL